MFPSRFLFMAQKQQQRWLSSDRKLSYPLRSVPVEISARSSFRNDQKRPPLLLVKSFFNLRHKDTGYGEDMSRVKDELSFPPHRNILIDILQLSQRPIEMDSDADTVTRDQVLPVPASVSVPDP